MVSVTMSADPPLYNPNSGIVLFPVGSTHPPLLTQIDAYYEANFRAGQMESFARFVLEKGYGACTPHGRKNAHGVIVRETWQACGRRLFGERFADVMDRALTEYRAAHRGKPPEPLQPAPVLLGEPPAHVLEEIPEPQF